MSSRHTNYSNILLDFMDVFSPQILFQELELMQFKDRCSVRFFSVFDPLVKIVHLQRPSGTDRRRVMVVGVAEV